MMIRTGSTTTTTETASWSRIALLKKANFSTHLLVFTTILPFLVTRLSLLFHSCVDISDRFCRKSQSTLLVRSAVCTQRIGQAGQAASPERARSCYYINSPWKRAALSKSQKGARQGVSSAWSIQTGPFAAHSAHFVPVIFQLFHFHTGRPILITPEG